MNGALVADDWSACHEMADVARSLDLDGVLGPSAALAGHQTLGVFAGGIPKLRVEHSAIRSSG